MRKALGFLCYTIMMCAYGAAAYISYRTYTQKISYYKGFLWFMPIFIVSYWFSTFSSQLLGGKDKNGDPLLKKLPRRILLNLGSLITAGLLGFWIYIYISRSLYSGDLTAVIPQ